MKSNRLLVWLLVILIIVAGAFFVWRYYFTGNGSTTNVVPSVKKGIAKENINIGVGSSLTNGVYPENDPEFYSISFNSHIFEPLITFNRENTIIPLLATRWDNPDNLTWRFYLSPQAKFSNNDPITANDVKFTFDYLSSHQKLAIGQLLPAISSVNVIDDQTVEFKTATPNPILLNKLALSFLVLSKKEVEANGLINHIGSGPYQLTENTETSIKFIRNENYWGTKPKIRNVTFKIIPKEADRITALLAGDIDVTSYGYSTPADIEKITTAATSNQIQKNQILDPSVVFMNIDSLRAKTPYINSKQNPLKDVRVRKAIRQGIDINAVLKTLTSGGVAASQIVSKGIFGYNPSITLPTYDAVAAKQLLQDAGYPNGFAMTIDYMASPEAEPTWQAIASSLATINITVKLNPVDEDKFFEKLGKLDTSSYVFSYSADDMDAESVLADLIHTTNDTVGQNNLGYSNTAVDKLIDEAGAVMDSKVRQQKLKEAMQLSMDDVALIPLFQGYTLHAFAKNVFWQPRLDGAMKVNEMAGQ